MRPVPGPHLGGGAHDGIYMRLLPPDKAVFETQVPRGVVYRMQKDGCVHVDERDAKTLREAGYTQPSLGGFARAAGWVCQDCHFHGYFKKCKCGSENTVRGDAVDL